MQLGILVPGRRCDLCNAMLTFSAYATPLGGVFCTSPSGDLPNCLLCSAPFLGGGRYCEPCAAKSINTQDHVRWALPPVRDLLHDMGVRLTPPVHVQLVNNAEMRTLHARESGSVLGGVTLLQGRQVTEVCVAAGLPAIEFGSTVAHECMHAWLTQNGFGQIAEHRGRAVRGRLVPVPARPARSPWATAAAQARPQSRSRLRGRLPGRQGEREAARREPRARRAEEHRPAAVTGPPAGMSVRSGHAVVPITVAPMSDHPTEGELDGRELTDRIEYLTWLCASALADLDRPGALGYFGTLWFER